MMKTAKVVQRVATTIAIGFAWLVISNNESVSLRADPISPTQDTDGDFLPDIVEWTSLSSAQHADTDSDGISDFVEFVQRTNPRRINAPMPLDHEMRLLVTSNEEVSGDHRVCLQLFFRIASSEVVVNHLNVWIEFGVAPGMRFPFSLSMPGTLVDVRNAGLAGTWMSVTVPLASEQTLRSLLPCTIGADGLIGTKSVSSTVPLFDMAGVTATLVPYSANTVAVQSIGASGAFTGSLSNRVCVLDLQAWQSVPGGTAYIVTHADCDDCNDLECGAACPLTEGWIIVLPGGLQSITGG
ncbi:hypothetical protein LBMAG49_07450 [Planctomycetota bacterium]|nr:hypothetical protein LBMAG49_07450 [Planctomycetota bacterium]